MTRRDMLEMRAVLNQILNTEITPKLAYLIDDVIASTDLQANKLAELATPSAEFNEFDEKRTKLCVDYAKKDGAGNPAQTVRDDRMVYDIPEEKREEFDGAVESLKAEYAEAIDSYEQQAAAYDKLCDGSIDINVTAIPVSLLPDMPGRMALILKPIVDTTELEVT
jgi:hypothetical protein